MPLAKIHVVEGRFDEDQLAKVSGAVQAALDEHALRAAGRLLPTHL